MQSNSVQPVWSDLIYAYQHGSWQARYYFDRLTGASLCVTEQALLRLESRYADDGTLAITSLDDDELRQAFAIEADDERFLKVPELNSAENIPIYDAFANSCDPHLQRLLFSALDSGDLLRFELILNMEPNEKARWNEFQRAELQRKLSVWLTDSGVTLC